MAQKFYKLIVRWDFLHDLKSINPNINVYGLENSKYAFNNTINDTIKKCFKCKKL